MASLTPKQKVLAAHPLAVCEADEDCFGWWIWTRSHGLERRCISGHGTTPKQAWERAATALCGRDAEGVAEKSEKSR